MTARKSFFTLLVLAFSFCVSSVTFAWTFTLNPGASQVDFHAIGRPSAIKIHGIGKGIMGRVQGQGNRVAGRFQMRMDNFDTGINMRNEHMKKKYLETAKYPNAYLDIKTLGLPPRFPAVNLPGSMPFTGFLTLHGVTRPVVGTANLQKSGGHLQGEVQFKIRVPDYRIVTPTFAGVTMADEVDIDVAVDGQVR